MILYPPTPAISQRAVVRRQPHPELRADWALAAARTAKLSASKKQTYPLPVRRAETMDVRLALPKAF